MSEKNHSDPSVYHIQPKRNLTALYAGLDIVAPDSGTWKAGYHAYVETLEETSSPDMAYWAALDASAPTKEAWHDGLAVIKSKIGEHSLKAITNADVSETVADSVEPKYEAEPLVLTSASREEKAAYRMSTDDISQDCITRSDSRRLYGVYDGMGGEGGNPAAASQAAAESIKKSLGHIEPQSIEDLMTALKQAHVQARADVKSNGEGGSTVATTVKIVEIDGKTYAGIAHAGDTRLFRYSKSEDSYHALTDDQSKGNTVYNGFYDLSGGRSDQYLAVELNRGDRLMLCSDGITGDWPEQFLTDEQFKKAFRRTEPSSCADDFLRYSKKTDDKSIIVVDAN